MQGTITLLNRLRKKDSVTNLDVWYKTYIQGCVYRKEKVTDVSGTTVSMGEQFTVLIPFTERYMPYREWKKLEDKSTFYTISPQDVIILGIVNEDVTPQTITQIKNNYEPDTCEIRSIEQVERKLSTNFEFRIGGV